ncbi:MAG: acyl-CoA reductase [Candidimonas sp.]
MTTRIAAGYLPGLPAESLAWESRTFRARGQAIEVALPRPTPEQLILLAAKVRKAAQENLAVMPVMDVVDAIDRCIARMLDAADPARQEMDRLLSIVTGFDAEMTRLGINAILKTFRRPQLLRFLAEDFGDPGLLDDFRPRPKGGWTRAYGPKLLGHVWAGNVPGLPLWSLVSGLLVKAGSLGKLASDEPLFAGWFARVLAEVEPRLADTLAIAWWPGGDAQRERTLAQQSEVLTVYGGDATLAAWRAHAPVGTRLLEHGHKLSAGLVSAAALDARQSLIAARLAATDMLRWDQQGCYSAQIFYVERGARVSPREFARQLAGELSARQYQFTRRDLSLEEAQSIAAWRQAVAMQAARGADVELLGSSADPWALAYLESALPLPPSALNRTACVLAVDSLDDAAASLSAQAAYLQTVGLMASPEELFRLAPLLGQAGATRLCALGSMTMPESGWHHDGRFSLLDLVRMVDIDMSAEQAAQGLADYRD